MAGAKVHLADGDMLLTSVGGVSRAIRVSAGTTASPGVSSVWMGTSDDQTDGGMRYSSGVLRFHTSDDERVRITTTGVAIGTNAIAANTKLQVVGNVLITNGNLNISGDLRVDGRDRQLAEMSMTEGFEQTITDASGFTSVTNWGNALIDPIFSSTHSNITVTVDGWYRVYMCGSFSTDNASDNHCHFYTNGATALDAAGNTIGWRRSIGTGGNQNGTVRGSRAIFLAADTKCSWRLDAIGDDENYVWDEFTCGVEKI